VRRVPEASSAAAKRLESRVLFLRLSSVQRPKRARVLDARLKWRRRRREGGRREERAEEDWESQEEWMKEETRCMREQEARTRMQEA